MAANKKTKKPKKKITTSKADHIKTVTKLSEDLLSLMGSEANVNVSEDKENEALLIEIDSEKETGLLIGPRGETLNAIQSIIGMIYKRKTGEWKRVLVNVSDWRERQKEKLNQLALNSAERVKRSGESLPLYNLTPSQRRIVHLALVDDKEVETESVGEGQDRHLVIHLKK